MDIDRVCKISYLPLRVFNESDKGRTGLKKIWVELNKGHLNLIWALYG